jgi:hypothetical protein
MRGIALSVVLSALFSVVAPTFLVLAAPQTAHSVDGRVGTY